MPVFVKKTRRDSEKRRERFGLSSDAKRGILVIVFLTIAALSVMSFWGRAGYAGFVYFNTVEKLFGQGYWFIPALFIVLAITIFRSLHQFNWGLAAFLGSIVLTLSFLSVLDFTLKGEYSGGYLGRIFTLPLNKFFGFGASIVILIALVFISLLVILNTSLRKFWIFDWFKKEKSGEPDIHDLRFGGESETPEEKGRGLSGILSSFLPKPRFKVRNIGNEALNEEQKEFSATKQKDNDLINLQTGFRKNENFELPSLDLLEEEVGKPVIGDINANVNIIKRTFENFGLEVEMTDVNVGPTVTQFTLKPATGVKLSSIVVLQNDLALALAAHPIRIEAPIPGRSLVGIEVPNKKVALVRLKNFLRTSEFQNDAPILTFAVGRDVGGQPIFSDLARLPHLLIAGATGAGKSICIHSLILSLLYRNSPESLRLILIDPKRVELTLYNDIPHLLTPVVVEPNKAINTLKWAVNEMESRYRILEESSVKDILSYNKKNSDKIMPYIVIVIDELADLMASYGREMEGAVVRLAQMSRAVGIHLVVSTQRPSVEVITGLIKANITSRIAFQVASQVDSRTILDMAGAEKLLGSGDMLFLRGDVAKPRRLQGVFISEKEVKRIAKFLKGGQETAVHYDESVLDAQDKKIGVFGVGSVDDELYEEAKNMVLEMGKASASLLQRRLRVGYARAARLLDLLEEEGVVGPADGAKPREILIKEDAQNVNNEY